MFSDALLVVVDTNGFISYGWSFKCFLLFILDESSALWEFWIVVLRGSNASTRGEREFPFCHLTCSIFRNKIMLLPYVQRCPLLLLLMMMVDSQLCSPSRWRSGSVPEGHVGTSLCCTHRYIKPKVVPRTVHEMGSFVSSYNVFFKSKCQFYIMSA